MPKCCPVGLSDIALESENAPVKLPSVFHDALIEEMTAGPRKELAIILRTVKPPHPQERYRVRFGAIENWLSAEVSGCSPEPIPFKG